MSTSKKEHIWYTGDWKKSGPPYNGLKIKATALYVAPPKHSHHPDDPDPDKKFVSASLEITDYTYDKEGVSSSLTLDLTGIWCDIPIPMDKTASPPHLDQDFTVAGVNNLLGQVKLDAASNGMYLQVKFRYGTKKREELGYIMKFDKTYKEGDDPIHVEQ